MLMNSTNSILVALATGLLCTTASSAWAANIAASAIPGTSRISSSGAGDIQLEAVGTNGSESSPVAQTHLHQGPLIAFGDVVLKEGDTAEAVVSIFGTAKVHGRVRSAAVAIWGNVEVDGQVEDAVVAVLGSVKAGQGAVIRRDVVAVLGDVTVDRSATIQGNAVAVGGTVDAAPGATISGQVQSLPFPKGLTNWFRRCVLLMRPLAPSVGWVWIIAGLFFLLYLAIAALFPHPIRVCVNELSQRPATTFLMGLLIKLFLPLLVLILAATGFGVIVVPFILAVTVPAAIVGKVALLEALGFGMVRRFSSDGIQRPLLALLLGAILLCLVYMIPVIGLIAFAVTGLWGLGVAITAGVGSLWRELPKRPPPAPVAPPSNFTVPPPSSPVPSSQPDTTSMTSSAPAMTASPPPKAAAPPVLPEVICYPKASFWERMGAGFLDLVLVGILGSPVAHFAPLVMLAYFAGMWAWKGTTVGGIVLGLKVVRLDGQPLSFVVCLVRSLAAMFSAAVLFLGFFWIAWDSEQQGWHDKIAGTVVVKLPRGTPLV
jgi:uncharacterized RDD family membrane protein YckC